METAEIISQQVAEYLIHHNVNPFGKCEYGEDTRNIFNSRLESMGVELKEIKKDIKNINSEMINRPPKWALMYIIFCTGLASATTTIALSVLFYLFKYV